MSTTPRTPTWDEVAPITARLLGAQPVGAQAVAEGGYSFAGRWVVTFEGGDRAFVKAEADWSDSHGVAVEHALLTQIDAPQLPRQLGYHDGANGESVRVLATEDLSLARWGAPLDTADAAALGAALDALEACSTDDLELTHQAPDLPPRWSTICAQPDRFVATGLVSAAWLEQAGPTLAAAERDIRLDGDKLVHGDLWVQNWCRTARGAVLVDWAGASIANGMINRAWGEAGVRAAGGPGGYVLTAGHPSWAAWMAGQTMHLHTSHTRPAPARLLETERREALAALRWACDELDLPAPDPLPGIEPDGPWRP